MSIYAETITAFNHLLENKPELFSTQERADLDKLIMPLADDMAGMSNALATWCESLPEIDDALLETQDALFPEVRIERGAGGTSHPEITPENERKLREQLINAIRRNNPAPSQESKPNHDSSQSSR
jgi:hypothetical protein